MDLAFLALGAVFVLCIWLMARGCARLGGPSR